MRLKSCHTQLSPFYLTGSFHLIRKVLYLILQYYWLSKHKPHVYIVHVVDKFVGLLKH